MGRCILSKCGVLGTDTEVQRIFGVFDGDETNLKRRADLYSSRSDMIVIVQYEIDIAPIRTTRKRKGGDRKEICKTFNICEVVLKFLTDST